MLINYYIYSKNSCLIKTGPDEVGQIILVETNTDDQDNAGNTFETQGQTIEATISEDGQILTIKQD